MNKLAVWSRGAVHQATYFSSLFVQWPKAGTGPDDDDGASNGHDDDDVRIVSRHVSANQTNGSPNWLTLALYHRFLFSSCYGLRRILSGRIWKTPFDTISPVIVKLNLKKKKPRHLIVFPRFVRRADGRIGAA